MEPQYEPLRAELIEVPGVEVRVLARCTSTNSILLSEKSGARILLAAEEQTAGRGRHGRRWESTPGADITFSLACPVRRPARELASLSLVAAVAAVRALHALGVGAVAVKWPNDLLAGGAKLGGILVETRQEGAAMRAVFGFGINCSRPPALERRLRRPVAALDQFVRPSRNRTIGAIARSLIDALERFEAEGFAGARAEWEAMDAHAGQRLRLRLANGRSISGIGAGLAADGALRLVTRRGELTVHSGRIVAAGLA
jgi:BirA family transcriptional regulator, biotin operon repressor / biotin---[acetyl-CoA-carboxylase] ligase